MFREHTQSFGTLLEENTNYLLVNPMFLGEQNTFARECKCFTRQLSFFRERNAFGRERKCLSEHKVSWRNAMLLEENANV